MKSRLLLTVVLLWAATARADSFWDSLWHNADQQGERLMQQGNAAAAAQTYRDPRRKAYAELQAGDFTNAANHFSVFDDSNGNYNRGNALARAGQLEEALKAYDAALAQNPNDKDARKNRDLVVNALQQQPPQSKSSADKNATSKDGKSGDINQPGQSGQSDDKNSGQQNHSKNTPEHKTVQEQHPSGQNKPAGSNTQFNRQPISSAQSNPTQANNAEQAKRDATVVPGSLAAGKANKTSGAPVSEQQLAQDQWLRGIPDDPGGLIRRKFMIEHLIRQQRGQQ